MFPAIKTEKIDKNSPNRPSFSDFFNCLNYTKITETLKDKKCPSQKTINLT